MSNLGGGRESIGVVQGRKGIPIYNKLDLNPSKGTRDFYPEDFRRRAWLFEIWRNVAQRFGFEEYDSPIVESEELYIRKAGEDVTQQLYNFVDKGNRRLSLRPEMTPSLARMVMARKGALPFPLKWFSIPQCWRYERMSRGRRREHFQWNMDVWGVNGVEAEIELLAAIVSSFQEMGITSDEVGIKVNSRKILNDLLQNQGVPSDKFASACVLIDKLEKIPIDSLKGDLTDLGLDKSVIQELIETLKMKELSAFADKLGNESEGIKDLQRLFELAEAYNIREWLDFDASVVRGLSYYTGIVFEGFDRSGEFRAICGGGRYDKLLESFGGESVPAVGFGFGDAVICELLEKKQALPDTSKAEIDVLVFAMDESLRSKAIVTANHLRNIGLNVDIIMDPRKPKWVFTRAEKIGATCVIMYGIDEASKGQAILKDIVNRVQHVIGEDDIIERVIALVADSDDWEVDKE